MPILEEEIQQINKIFEIVQDRDLRHDEDYMEWKKKKEKKEKEDGNIEITTCGKCPFSSRLSAVHRGVHEYLGSCTLYDTANPFSRPEIRSHEIPPKWCPLRGRIMTFQIKEVESDDEGLPVE